MLTHRIEQTTSTTNLARAAIEAGETDQPTIWVATSETAARGRQGRKWLAPEGGLWLSGAWPMIAQPGLSIGIGGAIAKAIGDVLRSHGSEGACVQLKWPNDILIDGAKVCGILCETLSDPAREPWLIVGVGVNVNNPAASIANEVDQEVTSLTEVAGHRFEMAEIERVVVEALEESIVPGAEHHGLERAAAMLFGIDQGVEVKGADESNQRAVLVGLSGDGRPLIEIEGRRRALPVGATLAYPERLRA